MVCWDKDFRQIVPVVERGSKKILYICIQHLYRWQEWAFAQWLLSVGDATNQWHGGVE